MNSREKILGKLHAAQKPFTDIPPIKERQRTVILKDTSPAALRARFIEEAQKLACVVTPIAHAEEAIEKILDILNNDKRLLGWDLNYIPLKGLKETLIKANITVTDSTDPQIRVGLTGADAALAATGSLVLKSGRGKPRVASLLPEIHIAVLTEDQVMPDLETWAEQERSQWQQPANITIISGASRTADIGMELVMGAHGPRELHLIILPP